MSDNVLDTRPPEITLVGSNRPHIRASALTRLATRRLVIILRQPLARVVSMFADQRHLVRISSHSVVKFLSTYELLAVFSSN
jgi:predicted secreted protein